LSKTGFTCLTTLIPNALAEFGDFLMNDQASHADAFQETGLSRLADMPVRLIFEVGRIEVSLSELTNTGPGHVFVLPSGIEGGCAILSGGAVIGRGEIVEVAGQFGVRVTQLAAR
jgi:type III secretion protein Q